LTGSTLPIEFEQVTLDLKAKAFSQFRGHLVGNTLFKIDDGATIGTDKVVVPPLGADVGGTMLTDIDGAHNI